MNSFVSIICIIAVLALTTQGLDAWKHQSSLKNGQKRIEKRLFRRQVAPLFAPGANVACDYASSRACEAYAYGLSQSGVQLQRTISYVQQRKLFVGGLVSLSSLQSGGMCVPNTNLFTANAFSAIDLGHITLPQLATLNLFPVQAVDANVLLNAGYVSTYGSATLLTALGVQASIFGHIVPSQLQTLNLYPLQTTGITADMLTQAGYLTSECIPTALGISALHIRYFSNANFGSLGCPLSDFSQASVSQLVTAKYVYGASNILTPVGLAALRTGLFTRETYQGLGIFPFNIGVQSQAAEYVYQETVQTQTTTLVNDLVHIGYLQPNNYLLTGAAYYAMTREYFSVEHFRSMNLWPCPGTPSMNMFVAAGYATYSGHLTTLGYSLLHAQYFPADWLPRLGIHVNDDFHIFHQALRFGGYFRSDYTVAHSSLHTAAVSGMDVAQVGAVRSVAGVAAAGGAVDGSSVFLGNK